MPEILIWDIPCIIKQETYNQIIINFGHMKRSMTEILTGHTVT